MLHWKNFIFKISCTGFMWQGFGTALPHGRSEQIQMLQRDPLLPELRYEWCWVCSGRRKLRRGNIVLYSSWERGVRNVRETALRSQRSMQQEGRCSRYGASAPCSPGETRGGADHPHAAHGHCEGRSPREATGESTRQQWMRPEGSIAHGEPHRSSPGHNYSPWRVACAGAGGQGELPSLRTHLGQCLKGGPHGMESC